MKAKCAIIAQDNDPIYISFYPNLSRTPTPYIYLPRTMTPSIYRSTYLSQSIYLSRKPTPSTGQEACLAFPLSGQWFSIMLQQILIFKGHLPIMNVPNSNLFSKDTSYFYLEDSISTLTRSATACEGEQQNLATAFLDGSQIYGGVWTFLLPSWWCWWWWWWLW